MGSILKVEYPLYDFRSWSLDQYIQLTTEGDGLCKQHNKINDSTPSLVVLHKICVARARRMLPRLSLSLHPKLA